MLEKVNPLTIFFFWIQTIFKDFVEFVTILLVSYILFFFFLALRPVGFQLPYQGLNLHTLPWKVMS